MGRSIINNIFLVFILFLCVFSLTNVNAATCDYKQRAEATKLAKNVTASYDIKNDENGSFYIEITIYNIVDGIYVNYTTEGSSYGSPNNVFVYDLNSSSTYVIRDIDITEIKKYTFKVYSTNPDCSNVLRSFTLTKPKYNEFSELPECGYYEVEDYLYCQKWITTNFNLSEAGVIERINEQRKKYKQSITTICVSCEQDEEYYKWLEEFYKIKKGLIIGLSLGIVADIVVIVLLFKKIKEDSII